MGWTRIGLLPAPCAGSLSALLPKLKDRARGDRWLPKVTRNRGHWAKTPPRVVVVVPNPSPLCSQAPSPAFQGGDREHLRVCPPPSSSRPAGGPVPPVTFRSGDGGGHLPRRSAAPPNPALSAAVPTSLPATAGSSSRSCCHRCPGRCGAGPACPPHPRFPPRRGAPPTAHLMRAAQGPARASSSSRRRPRGAMAAVPATGGGPVVGTESEGSRGGGGGGCCPVFVGAAGPAPGSPASADGRTPHASRVT